MKTFTLLVTVLVVSVTLTNCFAQRKLNAYRNYYTATEALLDSLEEHFNWCDRYDSEAVFNYYNAYKALK